VWAATSSPQQYVAFRPPHSWFYDTVRVEYAENSGAFLSLGGGLSKELRILPLQVFPAIWLVALVWRLVLSGGAGNLADRVLHHGRVVDVHEPWHRQSANRHFLMWPMSGSPLELCY
jgi:lipoprotein signal peptidase